MKRRWMRCRERDTEGIDDARRLLAEAHAATADINQLIERLAARRRENRFGPKIHAALQGKPT